ADCSTQLLGNVWTRHGAEQTTTFTGTSLEVQGLGGNLVRQRLEFLLLALNLAILDRLIVLPQLQFTRSGGYRETLRNEVVAGVSVFHGCQRTSFAKFLDVFSQN